jgi:hypothetical protein
VEATWATTITKGRHEGHDDHEGRHEGHDDHEAGRHEDHDDHEVGRHEGHDDHEAGRYEGHDILLLERRALEAPSCVGVLSNDLVF